MPDEIVESSESSVVEPTAKEKSLPELLAEFDGHVPDKSVPKPEGLPADVLVADSNEFEDRISSLEADNSALSERAEKAEGMAESVENQAMRNDQHDLDKLVKKLVSETGITKRLARIEIEKLYGENEDFAAAADHRLDDPERFASKVVNMIYDLQDIYPQTDDDHGLTAAVRSSREARSRSGGVNDYQDLSKLNTAEFAAASKQIFEDAKSGKLRTSRYRGGFIGAYSS